MTKRNNPRTDSAAAFDGACRLLESTLRGESRQEILAGLSKAKSFADALARLRDGMRSHLFRTRAGPIDLLKIVRKLDNQTRQEGFEVLHDWDGKADKLNKEIIPVDVANYIIGRSGDGYSERTVLAILLDYYFLYVLVLLSMRAWDEGEANANLDRVTQLLGDLQGSNGSGQHFAGNAETLILIATSHFEPDNKAYDRLLDKVRTLSAAHQVTVALAHAAILGSHLRFGFEAVYGKDLAKLRDDNVPDYPWLCFSLATLMKAYSRLHDDGVHGEERERIVEGILNGLATDTRAFLGKPPASLESHETDHAHFRELFQKHRSDLLEEFERQRPSDHAYSPVSLNFNFPHNFVKAMVVNGLDRGEPSGLSLNDLLTGIPRDERMAAKKEALIEALMVYARSSPDTIRGRPVPIIVYEPYVGLRNFAKTMTIIRERA